MPTTLYTRGGQQAHAITLPRRSNDTAMSPAQSHDEKYIRGIAASIEVATELILRDRLPKERDQHLLWNSALTSAGSSIRAYRELTALVLAKPDSYFEPVLNFLSDALANMPEGRTVIRDLYSSKKEESQMHRDILASLRDGAHHAFWSSRPDVAEWVDGVVRDVFSVIDQTKLFSVPNGKALLHHLVALRFVYGELLAAMTPYVAPSSRNPGEEYCSFAASAVQQVRGALMLETARRILESPELHRHLPELVSHASAISERNIRLMAVSALSQFDLTLRKLTLFKNKQSEVLDCIIQAALWENFVDHGLPQLSEFARCHPPVEAPQQFFIPGQLAFVYAAGEHGDARISGAFDHHSGCRFLAASSDELHGTWYQISGLALSERFAFAANDSIGIRVDAQGALFTSWEERLAPRRENEALAESRDAVTRCLSFVEGHLAGLWQRAPGLLEIMSEDEPTVLVFHGSEVFVLGTSLGENGQRSAFFAHAESAASSEILQRSGLALEHPELWFVRPLELGADAPSETPLPSEEVSRRALRRGFRDAISRAGQLNYRGFVASLSCWGVVETTDGRGGHGSLKRTHEGKELRTGTWGALRNPEKPIDFPRMYEILDALEIPIEEYTDLLLRKRL